MDRQYLLKSIFFLGLSMGFCTQANALGITGLQSYNFPDLTGTVTVSQDHDLCVYDTEEKKPEYMITAYGDGPRSKFRIYQNQYYMNLVVRWNDDSGTKKNIALRAGVSQGPFAANSKLICGGKDNANLEISINDNQIQNAVAGNYAGQIQLVVTAP